MLSWVRYLLSKFRRSIPDSPYPTFESGEDKEVIYIPLDSSFRFVHEPMTTSHGNYYWGRANEQKKLALRILYSRGASFLVSGYRGVGKTTFIHQTISFAQQIAPNHANEIGAIRLVVLHP